MTLAVSGGAALVISAGIAVATTAYSANAAKSSAIKNLNSASKAEGESITRERLNATVRNSYATAMGQMQLALRKRQLSQQGADITAATLAAKGEADVGVGSSNSIGASTDAVASDIESKSQAALSQTRDAFENAVENSNLALDMMVVNTDQSAPQVRQPEYIGPNNGEIWAGALMAGASSAASSYAQRKMSLGLGPKAPDVPSNTSANWRY